VPSEKKKILIAYLDGYTKRPVEETSKIDLNILIVNYQKWLNLFPFELHSYFSDLRDYYENYLPFIDGEPEVNRYSGMAQGKLHTKESLFQALLNLTERLLAEVNGTTLFEKGLITDAQKVQIELIGQERKQKLKDGYKNDSP